MPHSHGKRQTGRLQSAVPDRKNGLAPVEISRESLQAEFRAAGRALLEQYEHPCVAACVEALDAMPLTEHEIIDLIQEAGQRAALDIFDEHLAKRSQ